MVVDREAQGLELGCSYKLNQVTQAPAAPGILELAFTLPLPGFWGMSTEAPRACEQGGAMAAP